MQLLAGVVYKQYIFWNISSNIKGCYVIDIPVWKQNYNWIFSQNKSRALPDILGSNLSSQINQIDNLGLATNFPSL